MRDTNACDGRKGDTRIPGHHSTLTSTDSGFFSSSAFSPLSCSVPRGVHTFWTKSNQKSVAGAASKAGTRFFKLFRDSPAGLPQTACGMHAAPHEHYLLFVLVAGVHAVIGVADEQATRRQHASVHGHDDDDHQNTRDTSRCTTVSRPFTFHTGGCPASA